MGTVLSENESYPQNRGPSVDLLIAACEKNIFFVVL